MFMDTPLIKSMGRISLFICMAIYISMSSRSENEILLKGLAISFALASWWNFCNTKSLQEPPPSSPSEKERSIVEFVAPGSSNDSVSRNVVATQVLEVERIVNGSLEKTRSTRTIHIECSDEENAYWIKKIMHLHNQPLGSATSCYPLAPFSPPPTPPPPTTTPTTPIAAVVPSPPPFPLHIRIRTRLSRALLFIFGKVVEHFLTIVFGACSAYFWNKALGTASEQQFTAILLSKLV